MTEQVLTEDEKSALIDGVESGEIEVQSSAGLTYATVAPFRIAARSHIVKDSYPRLQLLNQQVAERLNRDVEQLLQREVSVSAVDLTVPSFGRVCEQYQGTAAVIEFEAAPLTGRGLIVLEPATVRLLVETFFGGDGSGMEPSERNNFTPGELSVSNLFATIVLSGIGETWASLQEIAAERVNTEVSIDLVDVVQESDPVISNGFEMTLSDQQCGFNVLLPVEMVQPLLPIFSGQKGDRDPAEDARWAQVIRRRLADSVVSLTSRVGHAQMTLGELVDLAPGDVIEIEQPQLATVMAKNVRLINGRLGIHHGRNAVETVEWIEPPLEELALMGN